MAITEHEWHSVETTSDVRLRLPRPPIEPARKA